MKKPILLKIIFLITIIYLQGCLIVVKDKDEKPSIKEDDKTIESLEKKIKTFESKVEKEKKTSELDNLNRLLQEYIRNKEEILKNIL